MDLPSINATYPLKIHRSKQFSIPSTTYFKCYTKYTAVYVWTLKKLNKTDLNLASSIDLSTNPTSSSSELLIRSNTLDFGLYIFKLNLVVYYNTSYQVTNSADVYVEIYQTGVTIFAVQYGISNILIGSKQAIFLKPSAFSIDIDSTVAPDMLSYLFYCSTNGVLKKEKLSSSVDLFTYLNDSTLSLERNQSCFGSKSENLLFLR